ncbi:hypothetical protein [Flavobacterium sp.]|uniref:hypothetical protein n=1 Tax=Flavobacterium sp. TaxID=239 RepID=UPI0025C178D0|nr:hypothetical protein [Flavobacterium sp.]MBA4154157.1 hypothetical protein [Flavobacterium sp.]
MSKVKNIINGWTNYLMPDDEVVLSIAKKRAAICAECPAATYGLHTAILPDYSISKIQGMYCSKEKGGCGCPLSTAVRSKDYKCIKDKW